MESLEHLIDYTSMSSVYHHAISDDEINDIIVINGDKEYMGKIAYMMTKGDSLPWLKQQYSEGKWRPLAEEISGDTGVYAIKLPPFYLIINTGNSYSNS